MSRIGFILRSSVATRPPGPWIFTSHDDGSPDSCPADALPDPLACARSADPEGRLPERPAARFARPRPGEIGHRPVALDQVPVRGEQADEHRRLVEDRPELLLALAQRLLALQLLREGAREGREELLITALDEVRAHLDVDQVAVLVAVPREEAERPPGLDLLDDHGDLVRRPRVDLADVHRHELAPVVTHDAGEGWIAVEDLAVHPDDVEPLAGRLQDQPRPFLPAPQLLMEPVDLLSQSGVLHPEPLDAVVIRLHVRSSFHPSGRPLPPRRGAALRSRASPTNQEDSRSPRHAARSSAARARRTRSTGADELDAPPRVSRRAVRAASPRRCAHDISARRACAIRALDLRPSAGPERERAMTLLAPDAARDAHDAPLPGARARPGAGAVALRWLGVAIAAAALWSTLRGADLPSVAALIASVGPPMMALALVPNLVARLFQAEASRRVFDTRNPASGRPAPFSRYLALTLSTEALNMSVPAGAALSESVTFYLLHRWCGIPGPQAVAGIAARRALIVLANAAYVAIALALGFGHLERASRPLIGGPGLPWLVVLSGLGLLAVALALAGALLSGTVASRVFAWLKRLPGQRVKAYIDARAAAFSATDRHAAALGERRSALAAAALLLLGMWLAEGRRRTSSSGSSGSTSRSPRSSRSRSSSRSSARPPSWCLPGSACRTPAMSPS